ncbi:MFS general substrate transporter [Aaosphaeria arxii CBS 175.79]|uniref:MFS general substrate transporter n=1 Tax=Aaosphaeria arxii CBS 175.79 TaxID=1450172 RepID=A0A6A5Y2Z2_9PLEO|nr:MFS general substrate transporter [Aaosphaeria arxii CBS 175.79]KAF2019629.1 MFS general substrate transporter [Aaosphaeria arxii CBS 175.79]
MFLTRNQAPRDPNAFPATQLFLLALVRVAEPIALTSIFPYAWKLVQHYHVSSDANAPFFAGILISAFSFAEAITGMYWGALSDRVGRKPVLIMGCLGTIASLLVFGFASNFWVALAGRILGGLLNGNIGVVQTMVGELVKRPEHEPKAYAVMPFVWSIGTIIGPSIGGCFAEPVKNFPSFFSSTGIFAKFPYLLPNLICALLLVLAIIAAYVLLDETHPDMQPSGSQDEDDYVSTIETPLLPAQGATANAAANLTTESYGTFDRVDIDRDELWRVTSNGQWIESPASEEKVITKTVIMFVAALGIFTYHSMTYDHLLPIFLQDKRADDLAAQSLSPRSLGGGLGLSIQNVGIIMSFNGIIQLFVQGVIFPCLASWFGVWKLLVVCTIGHPIAYFIVPYLQLLPENLLYPGIYTCLSIRSLFSILAYPLLLIMIKESAPSPSCLGQINGLAASTGAAARTVASPVAGLLYGLSIEIHFTPLAWWASALVAIIGVMQIPFLSREAKNTHAKVTGAARCCFSKKPAPKHEVVHITVEDPEASEHDGETV